MKRNLCFFILSLLGFQTACDKDKDEDRSVCMYGVPSIDFTVRGTVRSASGKAIEGIRVSERIGAVECVYTDSNGSFEYQGTSYPRQAALYFVDVDGEKNGGDFTDRQLVIEFTDEEKIGDGDGWTEGNYFRDNVEVVMELKEE